MAIVDTTEITCQGHINRLQSKHELGFVSDNRSLGYYLHPILCLDQFSKIPLGIGGVHLWNRNGISMIPYNKRYITERESNKWYTPLRQARDTVLKSAANITYVMDREADVYEVLEGIPDARTNVVIRSNYNRLVNANGRLLRIGDFIAAQPVRGKLCITLQSHKQSGQRIEAAVRFGQVEIPKVKNVHYLPQTRESIPMSFVDVSEVKHNGNGHERVHWRLWTSMPVSTLQQAKQIVDIYKSRWHIEELFRLMKTEAFDIESSELEKPQNLFKLGILVMEASVIIAQLKSARDIESEIKVEAVFTLPEIECLQALDVSLKGTTEKLSNPFNPQSLSWASWIIARIGGWKGYKSQRPPGSITYKQGLERFYDFYEGFHLARLMYKR